MLQTKTQRVRSSGSSPDRITITMSNKRKHSAILAPPSGTSPVMRRHKTVLEFYGNEDEVDSFHDHFSVNSMGRCFNVDTDGPINGMVLAKVNGSLVGACGFMSPELWKAQNTPVDEPDDLAQYWGDFFKNEPDEITAVSTQRSTEGEMFLTYIVVRPDNRLYGIGRAMVDRVIAEMSKLGANALVTRVSTKIHPQAGEFFKRIGFARDDSLDTKEGSEVTNGYCKRVAVKDSSHS